MTYDWHEQAVKAAERVVEEAFRKAGPIYDYDAAKVVRDAFSAYGASAWEGIRKERDQDA